MKSVNINFYSGKQWAEPTLVRKFPTTNLAWHIGRHEDIGYERFFVLNENNLHETNDPWDRVMIPWRKNEQDTTTFKWSDTEPVYDLPENLDFQFRWTTITKKRVKLWRRKP